jgi:hypothetical protein
VGRVVVVLLTVGAVARGLVTPGLVAPGLVATRPAVLVVCAPTLVGFVVVVAVGPDRDVVGRVPPGRSGAVAHWVEPALRAAGPERTLITRRATPAGTDGSVSAAMFSESVVGEAVISETEFDAAAGAATAPPGSDPTACSPAVDSRATG